jgi:hypothetical protein
MAPGDGEGVFQQFADGEKILSAPLAKSQNPVSHQAQFVGHCAVIALRRR